MASHGPKKPLKKFQEDLLIFQQNQARKQKYLQQLNTQIGPNRNFITSNESNNQLASISIDKSKDYFRLGYQKSKAEVRRQTTTANESTGNQLTDGSHFIFGIDKSKSKVKKTVRPKNLIS